MHIAVGASLLEEENQLQRRDHYHQLSAESGAISSGANAPHSETQDAWDVVAFRGGYVHVSRRPRAGAVPPSIPIAVASQQGWEVHEICFP